MALYKRNHGQVIRVERSEYKAARVSGDVVAEIRGTWTRGYGWCYIRRHPASRYCQQIAEQMLAHGCTQAEINSILS